VVFFLLPLVVISLAHFFLLIVVICFVYSSPALIAYSLNQIIRLSSLIESNRVNDSSIMFFYNLFLLEKQMNIFLIINKKNNLTRNIAFIII
jgi:hypothetical protein